MYTVLRCAKRVMYAINAVRLAVGVFICIPPGVFIV
jgi:hypothetical protein